LDEWILEQGCGDQLRTKSEIIFSTAAAVEVRVSWTLSRSAFVRSTWVVMRAASGRSCWPIARRAWAGIRRLLGADQGALGAVKGRLAEG